MDESEIDELMNYGDEFLEHVGVKGMKWGVRRSRAERMASRSTPSTVKVKARPALRGTQDINVRARAGRLATARGGKRNLPSEDAIKMVANRQKAKRSTTDSLTNQEMKQVIERLNMEQQFRKLSKQDARQTAGKRLIESLLGQSGNTPANSVFDGTTTTAKQIFEIGQ